MGAPCEYCGSSLNDDGANATDGTHHYAAQCREYVKAACMAYAKENAALRSALREIDASCNCEGERCTYSKIARDALAAR